MTQALLWPKANVWLSTTTAFFCMNQGVSFLPSIFLLNPLPIIHSLWFHSASSSHFSLPQPFCSHSYFSLSSHLSPSYSFPHLFCLHLSLGSQHQSQSLSLCLELIWEMFPNHQTSSLSSFPHSLIISPHIRLNSHMHGKQKAVEVDRRWEKERRGGWTAETSENKDFSTVCSLEAFSRQLNLQTCASTPVFARSLCFQTISLPPLTLFSLPFLLCFSSSFPLISSHPCSLSQSAFWSFSDAFQSKPLIGVWESWEFGWIYPWAKALLTITEFCEALSLFASNVHLQWTEPRKAKPAKGI